MACNHVQVIDLENYVLDSRSRSSQEFLLYSQNMKFLLWKQKDLEAVGWQGECELFALFELFAHVKMHGGPVIIVKIPACLSKTD